MPVFGNPLGLLALLGIPVVIAIHFLQRKAKEVPSSTLFLLEQAQREAAGGRRFERIRSSIPLWMQLLAVLLLAWFLAEPRYRSSESVQRVAVVLDSSASMSVFREEAARRLWEVLPEVRGAAANLRLVVLESAPNRPRLYSGSSMDEMARSLANWQPRDGPVDPTAALRLARSLVSAEGAVIYLTDQPREAMPFDARAIAVGESFGNVGFTGVAFESDGAHLVWRALVKNHGTAPAGRVWSVRNGDAATTPERLELAPGAMVTLRGVFPENAKRLQIELSGDRFVLDDVLPLVRPQPKILRVFFDQDLVDLGERLLVSIESAVRAKDPADADVSMISSDPADPAQPLGNAVIFVPDRPEAGEWMRGGITTGSHPLTERLNWQSLLHRKTAAFQSKAGDTTLLWQDKLPLVLLRGGRDRQLLFNCAVKESNLEKQPAFIVLLHRFIEEIRAAKLAASAVNLETGQPLHVALAPNLPVDVIATDPAGKPLLHGGIQHAMSDPGFLTIKQADHEVLEAAVHFGDPREADFSACGRGDSRAVAGASLNERHTRPDAWWRVWILGVMAVLMVSWKFTANEPEPA